MAVRPKTTEVKPRNKTIGPVFDLCLGNGARMPIYVSALYVKDGYITAWGKHGEQARSVEDLACELIARMKAVYGQDAHSEPPELLGPLEGPRGRVARGLALLAALDGPDGAIKTFAQQYKGDMGKLLAENMTETEHGTDCKPVADLFD
ncbi:MAG: hypothetical protein GY832_11755 [Chloroflexi bacterium]|nr:hypothetical protein [Chloroflexota bacterium]